MWRLPGLRIQIGVVVATVPEGECGPCSVFELNPGICVATEKKWRETLNQGSRKVPRRNMLGTIRLVDLATVLRAASTGLLAIITRGLRFVWQVNPWSAQVFAYLPK